jgi:hypothetical protein
LIGYASLHSQQSLSLDFVGHRACGLCRGFSVVSLDSSSWSLIEMLLRYHGFTVVETSSEAPSAGSLCVDRAGPGSACYCRSRLPEQESPPWSLFLNSWTGNVGCSTKSTGQFTYLAISTYFEIVIFNGGN